MRPKVQAEGIVKRFNWYPGIDADHVKAELDGDTWKKLFTDISPDELAKYGKPSRSHLITLRFWKLMSVRSAIKLNNPAFYWSNIELGYMQSALMLMPDMQSRHHERVRHSTLS